MKWWNEVNIKELVLKRRLDDPIRYPPRAALTSMTFLFWLLRCSCLQIKSLADSTPHIRLPRLFHSSSADVALYMNFSAFFFSPQLLEAVERQIWTNTVSSGASQTLRSHSASKANPQVVSEGWNVEIHFTENMNDVPELSFFSNKVRKQRHSYDRSSLCPWLVLPELNQHRITVAINMQDTHIQAHILSLTHNSANLIPRRHSNREIITKKTPVLDTHTTITRWISNMCSLHE